MESHELIGRRVYVDANVFIYGLEQVAPWAERSADVLRMIEERRISAITSELTLAECLVHPFRQDRADRIRLYELAVQSREALMVMPVTRQILMDAAQLRGTTALKLPDAIHAATAIQAQCDVILSNDSSFRALNRLPVVLLSEM